MLPELSEANKLSPLNAGIKFPKLFSPLNLISQFRFASNLFVIVFKGLGSSKSISSLSQNFNDSSEEHEARNITEKIVISWFLKESFAEVFI
jgi:hypothetical protein